MFPISKIRMLATNMHADLQSLRAGLSSLDLIIRQATNRWPSAGSMVQQLHSLNLIAKVFVCVLLFLSMVNIGDGRNHII